MEIRLATEEDIPRVAQDMRKADKAEIMAAASLGPEEALRGGYEASEPCYAVVLDEKPIALFGVAPVDSDIGVIWLLGTDDITKNPVTFMKRSKKILPLLIHPYKMVCNVVDKNNTVHVNWISKMGFSFIREIQHGPKQLPFYEFARINYV